MRQKVFGIASITTTTTAFLIAACSAPSPTGIPQQDKEVTQPGGSSKKDAGARGDTPNTNGNNNNPGSTTPGGDGGTPTATGPCGDKPTIQTCEVCCEEKQPKGTDFFYQQLDNCFCQTPGACKTQCAATICAAQPKAPDQACITCLDQNEACYDTAGKACEGNADCQLLLKCDEESQCGKKPKQ
jgi:hypothetical protein